MTDAHPSDSAVQRSAELVVLGLLSARLGVAFTKQSLPLVDGGRVEIDAVSTDPPVLCEIWAHQGVAKGAQPHKVMTDAMKLVLARSVLSPSAPERCRLILAFADERAAAPFRGTSWMAAALRSERIEVVVLELPEELGEEIALAQQRQFR